MEDRPPSTGALAVAPGPVGDELDRTVGTAGALSSGGRASRVRDDGD